MSNRSYTRAAVRQLARMARESGAVSYQQRAEWLYNSLRATSNSSLWTDAMRLVRWPFSQAAIEHLIQDLRNRTRRPEAFDSVSSTNYDKAKSLVSIRALCERYGAKFRGINAKCFLPTHIRPGRDTHIGELDGSSFAIDESTNRWRCFGKCEAQGDTIDLVMRMESLSADEAITRLEVWASGKRLPRCPKLNDNIRIELKPKIEPDVWLIKKTLAENEPLAKLGDWSCEQLLECYQKAEKPIVCEELRGLWPVLVGAEARRAIRTRGSELQYLCCSTGLDDKAGRRKANLGKRIWLCVEFDRLSPDRQLRLFRYLVEKQRWPLYTLTWSAGKSYHGLFYVRGYSQRSIDGMINLSLRLGACASSLRAEQWVRFPGGTRRSNGKRQEVYYYNREVVDGT